MHDKRRSESVMLIRWRDLKSFWVDSEKKSVNNQPFSFNSYFFLFYKIMFESEDEDFDCPLCMEELDIGDRSFRPCTCGYQVICLFINQ